MLPGAGSLAEGFLGTLSTRQEPVSPVYQLHALAPHIGAHLAVNGQVPDSSIRSGGRGTCGPLYSCKTVSPLLMPAGASPGRCSGY